MKSVKKYIVIIALLMASLILGSAIPIGYGNLKNISVAFDDDSISAPVSVADEATASPAADSDYDYLINGSSYYFSDVSKITSFRNGDVNTTSDVSFNTVNTSALHGSAENPYVINTVEQWNLFADDTAVAQDASKVIVLGADLNFDGKVFKPVTQLNAKFYGQNNALQNITYAFAGAATICGVFRTINSTVVADLSLDNVNFSNMGYSNGSIAGACISSSVLNCHFRGSLNRTSNTPASATGGIVGRVTGAADEYFYRCSAMFDLSIITGGGYGNPSGGILASVAGGARTQVLDCFVIVNFSANMRNGTTNTDCWFGGIAAYGGLGTNADTLPGTQKIDRCVAYTNVATLTNDTLAATVSLSSLFTGWQLGGKYTIDVSNCYTSSYVTGNRSLNAGSYYKVGIANISLVANNVNWFADTTIYIGGTNQQTQDLFTYRSQPSTKYDGTAGKTQSDLWSKAVSEFPDNIWLNKNVITDDYMTQTDVTSADGYTVYNSPVRNPLIIRVSYYNLTKVNGVEKETLLVPNQKDEEEGRWFVVEGGAPLVDLTANEYSGVIAANHIFKGWTADKSGNTDPINTVTGILGDVKLYAYWDIDTSIISATATAKNGIDTVEYGNKDGDEVILQGSITVDGISSLNSSYSWHKENSTSVVSTTSQYKVQYVLDSGTYLYDYLVYDNNEPLWRHKGSSPKVTGTVTKGGLSVDSFSLKSDSHAYVGRELSEVYFDVVMVNKHGDEVPGTAVWEATILEVEDGYNSFNIRFTPTDTNNYVTDMYPVSFNSEALTLTFDLYEISREIVIPLKYNGNYNYTWIIDNFNNKYAENAKTDSMYQNLKNRTPFFGAPDADLSTYVEINDFTQSYSNVKESFVLKVKFEQTQFTVTFNPDNGDAVTTAKYFYNNFIIRPTSNPSKQDSNGNDLAFIGWYYDTVDENNMPTTRAWSFDEDTVTKSFTLTARYLSANMVLTGLEVKANKTLTATDKIKSGDLTVTAKLHGEADGITIDQDIDIAFGDSALEYIYPNGNALSYDNPTLKVKYTYKGVSFTVDVSNLIVSQKEILLGDDVKLESKEFPYDGLPHKLVEIDDTLLPLQISSVSYVYYDASNNVIDDLSTLTEVGIYRVQAVFKMITNDYYCRPLEATLTIGRAATVVKLQWDTDSFVFNGKVQHPVAKLVRADGTEVNINFSYTGDLNVSAAGNAYSIGVKLENSAYQLEDDTPFNFTIEKAVFALPTQSKAVTYKGETIFLKDLLDIFDEDIMDLDGDSSGFLATSYSALVTLKYPESSAWEGSSSATATVNWKIDRASLSAIWNAVEFLYKEGETVSPYLRGLIGLADCDKDSVNYVTDFTYSGDIEVSESGAYLISVALNYVSDWANNYILDGNTDLYYAVVPRPGMTVISIEWEVPEGGLIFDGSVKKPTYTIYDADGNVLTDVQLIIGGDYDSAIYAGNYSLTAAVEASSNYFIRKGSVYDYTIYKNENGEGANPDDNDGNNGDGGSDILKKIQDFFKNLIENNFPLWQVITSAVALLLTLIFMIKAIQYGNRKKKAKNEAKKYKAKTMAAFLPIFSTEVVWLNLSNKVWSIIAFSLVGVTVLMFIIALITRKGWKKAELAKETANEEAGINAQNGNGNQLAPMYGDNGASLIADLRKELQETLTQVNRGGQATGDNSMLEQRLIEMEERRREDEERHRQEMETMKMMFANMMGRAQGVDSEDISYASINDTDLLVQKVIAGLLPAVQQMMPEATAYLAAPSEENEELKALVEEQSEEIRNMTAQMNDLQAQLAEMAATSQDRVEGVLLPDQSEDIAALTNQIAELQEQLLNASQDGENDHSDEIKALTAEMNELRNQLANATKGRVEVVDNSGEMKAMADEMNAMRRQIAELSLSQYDMSVLDYDPEDDDFDDEEEWDSVLDEDDDDFVESVIIEADGTVKKTYPNFRMRLKQSSDTNRVWYTAIKNLFCSQKGITYRVCKRVEKIRYQGQVIAVIGIAKKSIKLWLALKPYEYDARRYHHKDVSDKPRFVDVPMYVRVSSDRALTRAEELILALFQELNMEARKRYTDRSIQELIFTLKHNRLLTNKATKGLLCEVMHVHDCNVLDDETAEKCIENKNVDFIDESVIETVKLDDIDAKFQDGNRVTLERLKKVGLVSEKCTGYTVTANKRLTKPLIIVANDFTLTAVKLIALTGGRAVKLNKV